MLVGHSTHTKPNIHTHTADCIAYACFFCHFLLCFFCTLSPLDSFVAIITQLASWPSTTSTTLRMESIDRYYMGSTYQPTNLPTYQINLLARSRLWSSSGHFPVVASVYFTVTVYLIIHCSTPKNANGKCCVQQSMAIQFYHVSVRRCSLVFSTTLHDHTFRHNNNL